MRFVLALFLLCFFESCFFFKSYQRKQLTGIDPKRPIEVVIIPGLPLYHGQWDTLLKTRILWAEFLYKKGYAQNILFSGNAVYTKWKEGPSMALFADQLGIPKENILIDTLAEHSTENLYYGYQLAKQKGFHKIAVATDPFQCGLLKRYAKNNVSDKLHYFPIIYDSIRSRMSVQIEIDTTKNWKANFISIDERKGLKQRLNGTRGKDIENNN
jgi:uncharacterized SAM-binding protein YcdF (DUF218 family)